MGRIVTAVKLQYYEKDRLFRITIEHSEDGWRGATTGAKIYKIGDHLVHTQWGSGLPIAVYHNTEEMLTLLELAYKVKPVIIW